jgi:ankyrin repeat protein
MRTTTLLIALAAAAGCAHAGRSPSTSEAALLQAAGVGDESQVRALLAAGADVNARDEHGETALLRAARAGSLAVVKDLIAAKASVDASDRNGLTPLIEATRLVKVDVVRALLDAGANPNQQHRAFGNALELAEHAGQPELVALLRARGARGSGHSVGDPVCVRLWQGSGYCATIAAIDGPRYSLRVARLVGCGQGCAPEPACSDHRPVGGRSRGALAVGDEIWVEGACLTHTGLASSAE